MEIKNNNNILPFGKEQTDFINVDMLTEILKDPENVISSTVRLIHCNKKFLSNNNIRINNLKSKYAEIYNSEYIYVKISRDELMKQLAFVKTVLIDNLIIKFFSDEHEGRKKHIEQLKNHYLLVRTGLLEDDIYFSKDELDAHKKIKIKNLKKLKILKN
jgi:uncharacterized protein YqfB (UPF0267 family)